MRDFRRSVLFALLFVWLIMPSALALPAIGSVTGSMAAKSGSEPVLKVGLMTKQTTVTVSSPGSFVIRDAATKQGLEKYAAQTSVTLTIRNQQFLINGKPVAAKSLAILPADHKSAAGLLLSAKKYRGAFLVQLSGSTLTVINEVGLEDYLEGVVPAEMIESWPAEALKAQSVAARTFALYSRGRHAAEGYDLCADTHCQVYEGMTAETAATHAAVAATRGEVLCYKGQPIYAAFHSSSGGITAGSEEVWGNNLPYLRPVTDDDSASPHHHWQMQFTAPQVQVKLQAAGYNIGILKKIELTPLIPGAGRTADRSASGRVQLVRFYGTKGTAALSGTKMRQVFGLHSTLFAIQLQRPDIKGIDADMGLQKKEITAALPAVAERGITNNIHPLSNQNGEKIVFDGYGFGHGLGMSQWGAKAMAAKSDYRAILLHYYTNVELKKLY